MKCGRDTHMTGQKSGHESASSREERKHHRIWTSPCLEKYPDGHPVKTKNIEDLKKMIPYIPTEHRQFYKDLRDHVTAENVSEDEYEQ